MSKVDLNRPPEVPEGIEFPHLMVHTKKQAHRKDGTPIPYLVEAKNEWDYASKLRGGFRSYDPPKRGIIDRVFRRK